MLPQIRVFLKDLSEFKKFSKTKLIILKRLSRKFNKKKPTQRKMNHQKLSLHRNKKLIRT
jgi:hypothetical protein